MSFHEKLRVVRERAGLTQQSLAERTGMPLGTIRNYEQGRAVPPAAALFAICKAIGVSADEFAGCSFQKPRRDNDGPPRKGKDLLNRHAQTAIQTAPRATRPSAAKPVTQLVDFGATDRMVKLLRGAGIETMNDLAAHTEANDGIKIPGLGPSAQEKIAAAAARFWARFPRTDA